MSGYRGLIAKTLVVALLCGTAELAVAQKSSARPDGMYEFTATPHTGSLAVKAVKGGLLFELMTASPKGATCEARGKAIGGTVLTYRQDDKGQVGPKDGAGFRLTVGRDQITVSGLLGRVSDSTFCGLGALLTGVYKRSAPLDAKTAAELSRLETDTTRGTPPTKPPPAPVSAVKPR